MKASRRNFLKITGITGAGLLGAGSIANAHPSFSEPAAPKSRKQIFNMSGYAAPRLDVVRIGIIGIGNRGIGTVQRLASIEGVEITALCDMEADRVKNGSESIQHLGHKPDLYSGDKYAWKKVCDRPDIDLIAIVTPWEWHAPMAVYAMEHDKHVYIELPVGLTVDECWQVVNTSEKTRKHCVQMSDNCHGGLRAVILNMAREGFFGELVHGEGAYIHDLLLRYMFFKDKYYDNWRIKENIGKHGNLYPQHGLVPVMQIMDINYGDKMDYISSVSSKDFMMKQTALKYAAEDSFYQSFVNSDFRGNINTSIIRTALGRTMMIQHDVTSPRPNVRFSLISGTKGTYMAGPDRLSTSHDGWLPDEEFNELVKKYTPEINKRFEEMTKQSKQFGARSGYSRVMPTDWRLIDCLRNGLPMDMDVYEAASSSAVIPLSVLSASRKSQPVDIPDFTRGAWKTNPRGMDISLQRGGGTTRLR